jgi:nitroimidazol reductase NimA-like FMN-containing flavoprotein (pyridoxamine 5'-phosphate oxidase superfamily)
MRRADRVMSDEGIRHMLANGLCARLGTVGLDGWPYVVPFMYVWMDEQMYIHRTGAGGHFATNVRADARVCFEIDAPGEVFAYGRFECDTGVAYESVIAFGTLRLVEDAGRKTRFLVELMRKYADPNWNRAKEFFPRIDEIDVYAMTIERLMGKQQPLPELSQRWPALDRTKSPNATPPPCAHVAPPDDTSCRP